MSYKKPIKIDEPCYRCSKRVKRVLRPNDVFKDGLINGKQILCMSCRNIAAREKRLETKDYVDAYGKRSGKTPADLERIHRERMNVISPTRSLSKQEIAALGY